MITVKKKIALLMACITGCLFTHSAYSANWLMLQGTEAHKQGQAPRAHVWGFIQAQYQYDNSDPSLAPNPAGGYVPPKLIGPNLDDQSQFNVNRARIGVRGTGFPLDSKVNYFILAEFGNNGITYGDDGKHLTDASVTFNHIPGARVRVGQFKYPGAEEGLQAIHVFDYINFTSVTNQLLLERFPTLNGESCTTTIDDSVSPPTATTSCTPVVQNQAPTPTPNAGMNQFDSSVGAFRDIGIQVFDMFKVSNWEHSYALMVGNGNGINSGDNDSNKDVYLYWSSELVFGGKGGRREGLKLFAWHQDGKRTKVDDRTQEQDRERSGAGVKYLKKPFRATAEYMQGKGMIFQGQHRPAHMFNNLEAAGYYVEGGWYIGKTNFEIDLRWDSYTRDENHPTSQPGHESTADTITLGGQYHFNKKTRVNLEYASRDYKSDTPAVNTQQVGVDGRFAIQVTHIF
ncbi:MAG: porin [Thiotrichales bacterium]|nr:MAG: porin [Thiotrichales bacterium]